MATKRKSEFLMTPKTIKDNFLSYSQKINRTIGVTSEVETAATFNSPKSAIVDLVRDVRRKSLRRRKLWMNRTEFGAEFDQNRNHGDFRVTRTRTKCMTPVNQSKSKYCDSLSLNSYRKISSPSSQNYFDQCNKLNRSLDAIANSSEDKENQSPVVFSGKSRRRSSLFTPKSLRLSISRQQSVKSAVFGQGRSIPLKEGFILKKSSSWKSQDWNQKYVTLTSDGSLTYYPSYNAYLDETNAKTLTLNVSTVKYSNIQRDTNTNSEETSLMFEVLTPSQQKWTFLCRDQAEREDWVSAIKLQIKVSIQVLVYSEFFFCPKLQSAFFLLQK